MRNQSPKRFILELTEQIQPQMRYKETEEFSEWQTKARKKLYELLGMEYMLNCEDDFTIIDVNECDGYKDVHFSFQSEPGYYIPCHMLVPDNAVGKLPVLLCLQGHSKGMHISLGTPIYDGDEKSILSGDRNYAQIAVKNGYCAIAIEQRYMGECGGTPDGPGCLVQEYEGKINAMPTLLYGRTAIGERVHDVSRTIDVIEKNFDSIDTDNIMLTGNSGGGTSTFYAACIDERIKYAMPSCSVCTYKDSIINLHHCGCNYIPHIARYFDMGDLAGLIAPRKLVVVAGKDDPIFPIDGVRKAYSDAERMFEVSGNRDNIALVIGDGGHRYYAELAFEKLYDFKK